MKKYWMQSKKLGFSLFLVLPLFLFYEISNVYYHQGLVLQTRNSAELAFKGLLNGVGIGNPVYQAVIIGLLFLGIAIFSVTRGEKLPRFHTFFAVIIESLIYAGVLGSVTKFVTDFLLSLSAAPALDMNQYMPHALQAAAAGVYEEFLFRFVLLGFVLRLLNQLMHNKRWLQVLVATFVSSVLFSVFHYASFEYFTWQSFTFRFVAGFILGYLYVYRGLAVSVYTHAFYDMFYFVRMMV